MTTLDPTVTCDFGWHTRDVVDKDGKFVRHGDEVSAKEWTGHGETHHSCDAPRGHKGKHKCQWCEAAHR